MIKYTLSNDKLQKISSEYHFIKNINIYNKEEFIKELLWRLHYEVASGIISESSIKDNLFLLESESNRDYGNQKWLILIINAIIYNGDEKDLSINIMTAKDKYLKEIDNISNDEKRSELNEWLEVVKNLSYENAYDSIELLKKKDISPDRWYDVDNLKYSYYFYQVPFFPEFYKNRDLIIEKYKDCYEYSFYEIYENEVLTF